jgi:hypothetical protein
MVVEHTVEGKIGVQHKMELQIEVEHMVKKLIVEHQMFSDQLCMCLFQAVLKLEAL